MTDSLFERRLRNRLRETFDAEFGPNPVWAEAPALQVVNERSRGRRGRRVPLRVLAIAALMVVGGAGIAGLLSRPTTSIPPPVCSEDHAAGTRLTVTRAQSLVGTEFSAAFPPDWTGCGLTFSQSMHAEVPAMMVGVWPVNFVYTDPCNWNDDLPAAVQIGPAVADAEAALVKQTTSGFTTLALAPEDVTIDGFAGRHLRISVADDIDISDCDASPVVQDVRFWEAGDAGTWYIPASAVAGLVADIYLVDVGGERIGIQTVHFSDAPADAAGELRAIVDSIDFVR